MAFEKIKFAMKTWKDAVSGGTPISAAELNRIEKGISDCAKQTNELGDSVCQLDSDGSTTECTVKLSSGKEIIITAKNKLGQCVSLNCYANEIVIYDEVKKARIGTYAKTSQHSVSSTTKSLITGDGKNMIQLSWQNINGENYLCVTVNYVTALKIRANVQEHSVSLIGEVRTIQASRESTSEAMSAVFSRVWGQINLNCPTFIVVPSGKYGSAVLGIAFKTSDTYGAVFEIGYGNSAASWRLVNGQWIKSQFSVSPLYATGVNDMDNPPNCLMLVTTANPKGLPDDLGGNSALVIQQNPGSEYSAQLAFSFGGGIALRTRYGSMNWGSWKYLTPQQHSVSPLVGDGVITQITTSKDFGILLQILFTSYDGKKYSFSVTKSGLQVWNFTDSVTVWQYVKQHSVSPFKTFAIGDKSSVTLSFKYANHSTALLIVDNNGDPSVIFLNCMDSTSKILAGQNLGITFPSKTTAVIKNPNWSIGLVIAPTADYSISVAQHSVFQTSDGITAEVELNSQNLPTLGFRCGATRITVNFLNDRILVFNETESKHVAVFKKDEQFSVSLLSYGMSREDGTVSIAFSSATRAVALVMMDCNGKGKACLYFVSGISKSAILLAGNSNEPSWSDDGATLTLSSTDWNNVTVISAGEPTISFAQFSVSPLTYQRPCEVQFICSDENQFGIQIKDKETGNLGFITIKSDSTIFANVNIDNSWGRQRELQFSVSRCAGVDDMATRGAIGQRGEDVLKIGVVGESGNYVLCVRKNKALELYDRGNNRSLWTVNLSQFSVSRQPKISIGIVVVQYSAIQDSRAKLFTRAEVNSMFGSNANPDKTTVLLTNSNAQYGKTTMSAEYDSRDSTWYVRFTSAPNSNVQVTYPVIN